MGVPSTIPQTPSAGWDAFWHPDAIARTAASAIHPRSKFLTKSPSTKALKDSTFCHSMHGEESVLGLDRDKE
jgi:hypothetical protein